MKRKQKQIGLFIETPAEDPDAVYIGTLEFEYKGMLMSHMGSPNLEALHRIAVKLGIRKWFHDDDKHLHPHYDVCKSKKQLAIKLGVIEIDDKELINRCHPNLKKVLFNL